MRESSSFSADVNSLCNTFNFKSDYGNELFLYYCVPFLEKMHLSDNTGSPDKSTFKNITNLIAGMAYSLLFLTVFLPCLFIAVVLFCVFACVKGKGQLSYDKKAICFLRTFASQDKIQNQAISKETVFTYDHLFLKNANGPSVYSLPMLSKVRCLLGTLATTLLDAGYFLHDVLVIRNYVDYLKLTRFFLPRMSHKIVYQLFLDRHLSLFKGEILLSGNKEDRFAMLEYRLSKKHMLQSVCIPHGLEYGFRMPRGVFGETFYCLSAKASKLYSDLYPDQNFVFDEEVVESMFGVSREDSKGFNAKVVFFPESRDIDINREVIKNLSRLDLDFYLKLHPADSESNYADILGRGSYIKDLKQALKKNICLARRSTILLECVYHGSVACSTLFNKKDVLYVEELFPSLSDDKINRIYNLNELDTFLKGLNSVQR
ncbi:hypothetical protein [Pseudoalteromonas sp. OOF1S-7]|uniref:hypothetical protein n=1 Tax=Pseudoalteromonas sp. OOF1S-7 TaxID=2917757 RepID=UPI001EF6D348|nr:hypothetical protein [Pseudoalteromonas sp. OOF1S-7]MCG7536340.1 hypothetical protein [Pseudoalteromonas sp. OOF1S-7]